MIRHIVMWKFRPGTEAEQAELHASCEHIKGNIARLTWWDGERHPSLR